MTRSASPRVAVVHTSFGVVSDLTALFRELGSLDCADAADVNDSGRVDLADGVFLLRHLFIEGSAPRAPFPDCGVDPERDELGCSEPLDCD